MENEEYDIVVSPLCRTVEQDGAILEIHIYRSRDDDAWVLEVVDQLGTSTVWDDRFKTDQAALDEAIDAFKREGFRPFLTTDEPKTLH